MLASVGCRASTSVPREAEGEGDGGGLLEVVVG